MQLSPAGRAPRVAGGGTSPLEPALPAAPGDATALQWSRTAIDAVRRIDEFVVRYLDVAQCGLWSVGLDAGNAVCVDVFVREAGTHRRDAERNGVVAAALHRQLDASGVVASLGEPLDAGLLPAGASAVLAVALRRGNRLAAYLCAEQVGTARPWTADEHRFMKSVGDLAREVLALTAADAVPAVVAKPAFGDLPRVAYAGRRIGNEWTVTQVGEAADSVLGVRAVDLIGRPLHVLRQRLAAVPPSLPPFGVFEHGYLRAADDAAAARRFYEKGQVSEDAQGGELSIEGVITEVTAAVEPLADSHANAELLLHVSHELRTPLNAILGFAQLIDRDPAGGPAQRHGYVAQIQRSGRHLLEVIRETMDLSRLQAGPSEQQLEPLSLAKAVDDCLPMVSNQAAQAGVRVVNAVRDFQLVADRRSLQQALVNLLSNAVKYNRSGGSVYIESAADGDRLRIRVTDTGIGLSAEQTAALFQPFNRLGMERSDIEGVGLGLVITRKLIEAMGGRIAVASQSGVGSTFEVTLPRATQDQQPTC